MASSKEHIYTSPGNFSYDGKLPDWLMETQALAVDLVVGTGPSAGLVFSQYIETLKKLGLSISGMTSISKTEQRPDGGSLVLLITHYLAPLQKVVGSNMF